MDIRTLLENWEHSGEQRLTVREYRVRLPIHDAARLAALEDLYPLKSKETIISELLGVALDAVQEALPYRPGSRVIAEDEMGDPIYEDTGPTPRFLALTRHHAARLQAEYEQAVDAPLTDSPGNSGTAGEGA